jgi:ABC-2 type transport system permease protein
VLLATFRGAVREAWANRQSFWLQVSVMATNDLAWVAFWVLFFHRVGQVRGWDVELVLLLQAMLTTVGGLAIGVFANARQVGRLALTGGLDAVLTLPVAPLPYLLVRRLEPIHVGDLVFGVVLFSVIGAPDPRRVLLYLIGVVTGTVVLTGFLVAVGSLTFFAGRAEGAELGFHAIILLSSYPVDVFGPGMKAILYTVVPAAFVAAVPARFIESFAARDAVAMVAAAAVFGVTGWATFTLGLRRYTSGAVWTRA